MSDAEDADTTRKTVKTFVPAYQKDEWKRHADDLGMSQSEFVRTMVQAGRRDFEFETAYASRGESERSDDESDDHGGDSEVSSDDGGSDGELKDRVLAILSASDHLAWDELVDALTEDLEDRLDETIQRLQAENRVRYSGRHGGYALLEDDGN